MFAIAEIGGHQYKVSKGDVIAVQKLDHKEGDKGTITTVLLVGDDKKTTIGTPYVKGAVVEYTVKAQKKAPKIRIFKKKPKKRYERTQGHRQQYTEIEITAVK